MHARSFTPRGNRTGKEAPPEPTTTGSTLPAALFYACAVLIVALQAYAAFRPSSLNWGFHQLAFFGLPVRATWIVLALLVLIPPTRRFLLRLVEGAAERASRMAPAVVYPALIASWAALCWFVRTRWFLLGDSQLTLRDVERAPLINAYPNVQFSTEPFSVFVNVQLYRVLSAFAGADVITTFRVIGVVSGIVFLLALVALVRRLASDPAERLLLGALVLCAGSSQLFFGYPEDYTLLYAMLLLYLVLGTASVQDGRRPLLAALTFTTVVALHMGAIVFAPSLVAIFFLRPATGWRQALITLGAAIGAGVLLLLGVGYPLSLLAKVFGGSESHLIPLTAVTKPNQNFPALSWQYLVEQTNVQILIAPLALPLVLALLAGSRRTFGSKTPMIGFLSVAACCGLAFVAVVNPNLGYSRDWDLFAPGLLPVIVLAVGLYAWQVGLEGRKEMLFTAVCIMLLHTVPWVGVNASTSRSEARHRLLPDRRLWGESARVSNLEELGIYYRDRNRLEEALAAYREIVAINPNNPRIHRSIATVCQRMGDAKGQRAALEEAVGRGYGDAQTFVELAMLVWDQTGDVDRAIGLARRGVEADPGLNAGHHDLGVLYFEGRRDYRNALESFERAIETNPADTSAYKGAAIAAYLGRDLGKAKVYVDRYRQYVADDPEATMLTRLLESAAARKQTARKPGR